MRKLPLLLPAILLFAACSTQSPDRTARLLTMAGEEAASITSFHDRLTRQLNIAQLQINNSQKSEAVKTLALATATLNASEAAATQSAHPNPSDEFDRIAGWTSIAELSHQANSDKAASDAYLNAVEALHSISPESSRAQYVLSLSYVAAELKGKIEAGRLLVSGGEWAAKMTDIGTRRYALRCFASALVEQDNLEAARTVLRQEADAAWRADTLASLAGVSDNQGAHYALIVAAGSRGAAGTGLQASELKRQEFKSKEDFESFNKDVRFNARFKQNE